MGCFFFIQENVFCRARALSPRETVEARLEQAATETLANGRLEGRRSVRRFLLSGVSYGLTGDGASPKNSRFLSKN
jgi:hypothetical protein